MIKDLKKRIFVVDSESKNLVPILDNMKVEWKNAPVSNRLIQSVKEFRPHLLLGDFGGKKAESIITQMREDDELFDIPVILCTDQQNITHMIRKVNGNVNDYIVKPYINEEVGARIERVLKRHDNLLNKNPLSHLPGNTAIKLKVDDMIHKNKEFSLIYMDLDHFKAFNDFYGYSKGDEVIKYVAKLSKEMIIADDIYDVKPFVGHIGGDDFIIIRSSHDIENFCERFITRFTHDIKSFYDTQDIRNNYITTVDRKGHQKQFPLMSITLAVIVSDSYENIHYGEISLKGAEIKKYLKKINGSNFLIDRRKQNQHSTFSISKPAV